MPLPQQKIDTSEDYWNVPEGQRAELIDGQLYDMAPPNYIHQKLAGVLYYAIFHYIKMQKGTCEVIPAPFAVNLNGNDKTWVDPDISVICDKSKISNRGCEGAPDWIIEIISPGTSSHDYVRKLNLYLDAGVKEYWIADPMKKKVLVYHLEESGVELDIYSFEDKVKTHIYEDLWIDFQEIGE